VARTFRIVFSCTYLLNTNEEEQSWQQQALQNLGLCNSCCFCFFLFNTISLSTVNASISIWLNIQPHVAISVATDISDVKNHHLV